MRKHFCTVVRLKRRQSIISRRTPRIRRARLRRWWWTEPLRASLKHGGVFRATAATSAATSSRKTFGERIVGRSGLGVIFPKRLTSFEVGALGLLPAKNKRNPHHRVLVRPRRLRLERPWTLSARLCVAGSRSACASPRRASPVALCAGGRVIGRPGCSRIHGLLSFRGGRPGAGQLGRSSTLP